MRRERWAWAVTWYADPRQSPRVTRGVASTKRKARHEANAVAWTRPRVVHDEVPMTCPLPVVELTRL